MAFPEKQWINWTQCKLSFEYVLVQKLLRFLLQCGWGLSSSGMWCPVGERGHADIWKEHYGFMFKGLEFQALWLTQRLASYPRSAESSCTSISICDLTVVNLALIFTVAVFKNIVNWKIHLPDSSDSTLWVWQSVMDGNTEVVILVHILWVMGIMVGQKRNLMLGNFLCWIHCTCSVYPSDIVLYCTFQGIICWKRMC